MMIFKTPLAVLVALAAQAVAAEAPQPIRATMAAPVAQDGAVRAQATSWMCTGALCTGPEINGRFGDARACREVAKAVGAVTAFSTGHGEFAAEDLARCNKSAKKAG